jgi:hypothetical protein
MGRREYQRREFRPVKKSFLSNKMASWDRLLRRGPFREIFLIVATRSPG